MFIYYKCLSKLVTTKQYITGSAHGSIVIVPHAVFVFGAANPPVDFSLYKRVAGVAGVRNFRERPVLVLEVGELYRPSAGVAAGRRRTFCVQKRFDVNENCVNIKMDTI